MAIKLADAFIAVMADDSKLDADLSRIKSKTQSWVGGAVNDVKGLLGTGIMAAAGVALGAVTALGVGLGASVKAATDMQQGIADIMAVMGEAAPPVKELSDAIQGLGLDPKLKVSAFEAADAIEMLAKNGVTWTEIQDGMARSTVLLANATNDNFALAADVATNAMVNFNKNAGDMQEVVDGIIGVTQASQFDINDYALAIAQAGGVAGSVGVEFDDFNAALTATSSSFSSGSDAGTSFKVFLQRLVPDTDPAAAAMRDLGLLTEEGGNAFFDAAGNMESMSVIAEALQTSFAGLTEEQKINAATNIFGTDAMRTAFALADAGAETIDALKLTIGNTSAEEAAATRMDTLKGAWEIFTGVVETLSIQIGTAFLPVITSAVKWITDLATKVGPQVIEWVQNFSKNITELIENFGELPLLFEDGSGMLQIFLQALGLGEEKAQAIGIAVYDFIQIVKSVIRTIGDAISPFVSWKDVLGGLAIVIGVAVVSAIASFIAAIAPVAILLTAAIATVALFRNAWERDWGGIQEKTRTAIDFISGQFASLQNSFTEGGPQITNWFEQTFPEATAAFQSAFERLSGSLSQLWTEMIAAFSGTATDFQALFTQLQAWWQEHGDAVVRIVDNFLNSAIRIIETVLSTITGLFTIFFQLLQGDWEGAWNTLNGIVENIWGTIIGTVGNQLNSLFQLFTILDWTGAGEAIVNGVWNGMQNAWGQVEEWFRQRLQELANLLPFSEPKDATSPLRGLSKSGEAIVSMLQIGIDKESLSIGAPDLSQAMVPSFAGATTNTSNSTVTFGEGAFQITVQGGNADRTTGNQIGEGILETLRARGLA